MARSAVYDIFVIGGGINGCGIARDAAGRGYSVYLAEMNDLAGGTSSASTKLIHGGLRYLEHYEFRLVREALMEREVLLAHGAAHHLAAALRAAASQGPAAGLAAAARPVPLRPSRRAQACCRPTRTLDLRSDPAGKPLKPHFGKAFEYSDCWVDDARLVVLNARDAADRGARDPAPAPGWRRRAREGELWHVDVEDARSGAIETVAARLLVNAAGPWVDQRAARRGRPERRPQCAPGAGQPHRRREEFDARPRLFLPERRRPHHLRHSLRGRFHADRHDRPGL